LISLNCDFARDLIPVKELPTLLSQRWQMISLEDCIAMCGLTETEIAAIAEHEHMPDIAAATLGRYLMNRPHGVDQIRQMIVDDIRVALCAGNKAHAGQLLSALRHLLTTCSKGCGPLDPLPGAADPVSGVPKC